MAWLFQISVSDGGVPKLPVQRVRVGLAGAAGDRQRDLEHHGGPERALCLYSLERILALQQEGHPIVPGAVGENLTLTGVEWDELQPGVRLAIGEELQIEITSYTDPCATIAAAFRDGEISRILESRHPGWSRLYARVIRPGEIMVGDAVERISVVAGP